MTQPNGSTVRYQFDRRNRLTSLLHHTAAGALLLGLNYSVDASGLRTQILESTQNGSVISQSRSAVYTYDDLKRLTRSTVTGSIAAQALDERFTYDAVGNRLTRVCVGQGRYCTNGRSSSTSVITLTTTNTYDANDRLTTEADNFGSFTYAYDAAGNLLSKKQGSTLQASYTWDIENRLREATQTAPNGSKTITRYQYDPNGIRRVSEVVSQTAGSSASTTKTRTEFLIDPNQAYAQVLEDWSSSASQAGTSEPALPEASLQNSYIHGDDLIAEIRYASTASPNPRPDSDGGNEPNALIGANTGTSIYHYDGLGSTRLLSAYAVDATGNPITTGTTQNPANETATDRYAYTAFGEPDLASSTGTTQNNYRYTGEQLDPNLGWYYLRARYMNPAQGRFVGMDSWMGNSSDPVTLHKYLYANANPVMWVDPSGNVGLIEESTAYNIRSLLANMQTELGFGLLDAAMSRGEYDPVSYLAAGIVWGAVAKYAPKAISLFFRRGCSPNSFAEGTLVHSMSGLIAIENIDVEDEVIGFDPDEMVPGLFGVTDTIARGGEHLMVVVALANGEIITATDNHPFYVVIPDGERSALGADENGAAADGPNWINAGLLRAGDMLMLRSGHVIPIIALATYHSEQAVYNISVRDAHTYFVGESGVLTHNISCRVPKLGGSYFSVRNAYKGKGGEVNHIPPKSVSGLSEGKGPAIFMDAADHRRLLSTGSSKESQLFRKRQQDMVDSGNFEGAFELEVSDIRTKFGSKYDVAITQAYSYCREIGACK